MAAPWTVLGIAPTSETREIRRAYARLLKTIDVEAEPDRFVALRDAFDRAVMLAETGQLDDDEPDPAIASPLAAGPLDDDRWSPPPEPSAPEAVAPPPASQPPPPSPRQDAIDRASGNAEALARLLLSHQQDWLTATPDEAEAMLGLWRGIVADPRFEELDHYAQVEQWIAEIVARGCPFSDPLARVVAERFGWIAHAGTLGQSPAVRFVVDRCATLDFLSDIAGTKHPLHRAWRELTTPATESSWRGWGTTRKSVIRLLTLIRRDHPAVEHQLDTWRVALWEQPKQVHWGRIAFGVIVALQLVRLFAAPPDTSRTPSVAIAVEQVADRLTQPDGDIDRVMKNLSQDHVAAGETKASNPALHDDLTAIWQKTQARGGTIQEFQRDASEMMTARFTRVYGKAPYDLIKAFRQVQLEEAQFYRSQGATACDDYLSGNKPVAAQPPLALLDRQRNSVYDILLGSGADRPGQVVGATFMIPGDVSARAAKAASLSHDDFHAAMNRRGTPGQRCAASIAFSQTILSLPPKQALRILREM